MNRELKRQAFNVWQFLKSFILKNKMRLSKLQLPNGFVPNNSVYHL